MACRPITRAGCPQTLPRSLPPLLALLLCAPPLPSSARWTQKELAISFFLDPAPTLENYQLVAGANFTVRSLAAGLAESRAGGRGKGGG